MSRHGSSEQQASAPDSRTALEAQVEALAEQYLEQLQAGLAPDRQALLAAHPDLAEALDRRLALVEMMFRVAKAAVPEKNGAGSTTAASGVGGERALRIKCPHCGNRIQLVEPDPHEVICASCGSSFQVDVHATTPHRPAELPGTIGKFVVLELLGRGAFGAVYKARDPELDRIVAVKVPRAGYFDTPEDQERFLREARSAARLQHPGIVTVHEVGHERGVPYIVSDYVEGLTLADVLTGGRPDFRASAEMAAQVADALAYAHQAKVIHRDIKPSNILIEWRAGDVSPPVPHLTDFGLARRDEGEITVTVEGQILGTPAYMSPEQAAGESAKVDARSDVYSLGVVLYELLTGELPFRGNKRMLLHQVLHDEPRAPRSLNDRIPRDLQTICLKAMAKEPRRRYASAKELADDLRRFLRGEPIHARPVGRVERTWRWCRRNPVVASLLGAVAAALVGIAVVATVAAVRIDAARDQEKQLRAAAEKDADDNRSLLGQQFVSSGAQLMDEGDLTGALAWFVEALQRDQKNPERERMHRMRIRATLEQCPRPVHVWFHDAGVFHSAFSPDGRRVLSIPSSGNALHVWDTATGEPAFAPLQHPHSTGLASFSPDSRRILTFSHTTVRLWDANTGHLTAPPLEHRGALLGASFTPDSRRVLTLSREDGARVWDVESGRQIGTAMNSPNVLRWAEFSPDGQYVLTLADRSPLLGQPVQWNASHVASAVGAAGQNAPAGMWGLGGVLPHLLMAATPPAARVWDATSGRPVTPPLDSEAGVTEARFTPDSRRVVTAGLDGSVLFWDVAKGEPVHVKPSRAGAQPVHLEVSADGRHVLAVTTTATAGEVWVRDTLTGAEFRPVRGKPGEVYAAFSPDGRYLVTTRKTAEASELQEWDLADQQPVGDPIRPRYEVSRALYSPDGRRLATISGDTAQVWGGTSSEALTVQLKHGDAIDDIQFSPDARYLLTSSRDGTVRLWDLAGRSPLTAALRSWRDANLSAFSADGERVALSHGHCQVFHARTGQPISPVMKPEGSVENLMLSADGRRLAMRIDRRSDPDRPFHVAQVWDVATGKPLTAMLHHGEDEHRGLWGVTFSPDGSRVLTVSGSARAWDASTGRPLTPLLSDMLGYSDDVSRLATVAGTSILVWDLATGKVIATLAHEQKPHDASFTPDGSRLVTACKGEELTSQVHVWEVAGGRRVSTLKERIEGYPWLSADGRRVLCNHTLPAHQGHLSRVWDADTGEPLGPTITLRVDYPPWQKHTTNDGKRVLVIRRIYGTPDEVRILDTATGQPLTAPMRDFKSVAEAAFSPNNRYVVTMGQGKGRVWDVGTGQPLTPPLGFGQLIRTGLFASTTGHRSGGWKLLLPRDLDIDDRPVDDLLLLAQALSGTRIHTPGSSAARADFRSVWQRARAKFPTEFVNTAVDNVAWHREEAAEAEHYTPSEANAFAAVFHLDRLIAAGHASGELYARRARQLHSLRKWERVAADCDRAVEKEAADVRLWEVRGDANVALRQYDKAADSYAHASTPADAAARVLAKHALLRVQVGDLKGYRETCARLLERRGKDRELSEVLWVFTLAPEPVKDLRPVLQMVEEKHAENEMFGAGNRGEIRLLLGCVHYRMNELGEATRWLDKALGEKDALFAPHARALLAMVHHRLNRLLETKAALRNATLLLESRPDASAEADAWMRDLTARMLKREAEAMMREKKPGE